MWTSSNPFWPLGDQINDFIFLKWITGWLTTVSVENQPFYCIFKKFMGFGFYINQKKCTLVYATMVCSCLKTAWNFQHISLLATYWSFSAKTVQRNRLFEWKYPPCSSFSKFNQCAHQRKLFFIDLESKSHELIKNVIKRLIFEWHGG